MTLSNKKPTLIFALFALLLNINLVSHAAEIAADENHLTPLLNGHMIPAVNLKDINGAVVDLQHLAQQKPTIFFFYRGGWCPFCNSQMGQLKAIEPHLIEMGFQLIGISPDTPAELRASINDNELKYTLLSDADMKASQAFGIAYYTSAKVTQRYIGKMNLENPLWTTPFGDKRLVLPIPAVYIADKKGLIQFQYLNPNFRVRPDPELILKAASLIK